MRIVPELPAPHSIGTVPVHPVRLSELLAWIEQVVARRQQRTVMYANAHAVMLAQQDALFRDALNQASLVFCDGNGVRLASYLLGTPLPDRFTPPDWIDRLSGLCVRNGFRLFLLGAQPGVAAAAAERLRATHPALQVTTRHGYFAPQGDENEQVLAHINEVKPHLLLVGMGMPRQEQWVLENLAAHQTPVVIVVGALFDYLAGQMTRGPRWLTDHGLEWLCRLVFEPRRLWRRYLLGNPAFVWLVLREWARQRFPLLPVSPPLPEEGNDPVHSVKGEGR